MQFVVTDAIYTHSATTTDSHLRMAQAGAPFSTQIPLSDGCEKQPIGIEVFFDAFGNSLYSGYAEKDWGYGA